MVTERNLTLMLLQKRLQPLRNGGEVNQVSLHERVGLRRRRRHGRLAGKVWEFDIEKSPLEMLQTCSKILTCPRHKIYEEVC